MSGSQFTSCCPICGHLSSFGVCVNKECTGFRKHYNEVSPHTSHPMPRREGIKPKPISVALIRGSDGMDLEYLVLADNGKIYRGYEDSWREIIFNPTLN